MKRLVALFVLLGAAAWPSVVAADEPVSASLSVDRNVITIGDQIRVVVVVTASSGYHLGAPLVLKTLGDFEVVEAAPPLVATPAGGGTRYTFRYWITTFTLGDHLVPAIEFPYSTEQGQTASVRTAPIAVRVRSVVAEGESVADIKPLKPQLDLPGTATSRLVYWSAAAVIVVVIAIPAILLYRRWRRRAVATTAPESAVQETLDELARIAELRLPEKGRHDEHYARVAAALRRYLARQFDLPADRRTARELHQAMERAGIERRQAEAIYELLRENEAVRFERAQRQPRHAQQALADAMTALARARAAERRSAELVT